ncbi:glycosyl hydrolase family 43 [Mucilaginibacter gracilis]|uniref:Glycosyl hydrolase family 43 n=1 Tax=Mucilaginibacter gracilis TaxID=423350 RepID=A0A495JAM2_9SPHI|nr:family 43 glycosylhydrolase [Mucilaginibacter gracilis]RKR85109.1 glycosyl hydrolase family 43 [Mucilaginibacter gracilis]
MKKSKYITRHFYLTAMLCIGLVLSTSAQKKTAYLFTYFTGNGKSEEAIHFAVSSDGYHYQALNHDAPVLNSRTISSTGGVRDPHILRGADNKTCFMVATDMQVAKNGWGPNTAMVLLRSTDLVNWSSVVVDIPTVFKEFAGVNRVWAPQTIYDEKEKKYMLYWSMRFGNNADIIYYAYANKYFTGLESEPRQLFFSPTQSSCIDADIILKDGKYNLFFKTEGLGNGIKKAVSTQLTRGYIQQEKYLQQTSEPVEGSGVFKLNEGTDYILMYDLYTKGRYQFTRSSDLENFKVIDQEVTMDFHPRHGTVLPITAKELGRLKAKWGGTDDHNPVLKGEYADPEILYSQKTGKYYIYPTSDGFTGWSGTYFKTFSSTDLINWKDEGVILDLPRDVSWAKRNAWAPTIAEKKKDGLFTYYYYFCAAQQIGVATANDPAGPFKDSGKPLITKRPPGVKGGQQIDPDVFTDPKTGESYLFWGNGYLAGAKLNQDMISVDTNSIKVLTPNQTFREGTEVFYRKGKYYFMWSDDDTRSENYKVRYGIADAPLGPITVPENNLVLAKDPDNAIYGTGHNAVLQIPGKDEWYIVYHRFNRPKGITMGDAAGYHREVCIDKLEFNPDGSIKQVTPTVRGIKGLK